MSAYTAQLRDAIFHARNTIRSLELAQAHAPADHKPALDVLLDRENGLIVWAVHASRHTEQKGGYRTDRGPRRRNKEEQLK